MRRELFNPRGSFRGGVVSVPQAENLSVVPIHDNLHRVLSDRSEAGDENGYHRRAERVLASASQEEGTRKRSENKG